MRELAHAGEIELRQTVTRGVGHGSGPVRAAASIATRWPTLVHDPSTLCFVCGPPALVDEMPKILAELGIPRERIKIEEW